MRTYIHEMCHIFENIRTYMIHVHYNYVQRSPKRLQRKIKDSIIKIKKELGRKLAPKLKQEFSWYPRNYDGV